ncbi:G-protein coupled receptor 20 [Osmerus mordax]|uniref:G-protein coupled receptor 20 n=1 Tax=Osmerus mordax TaxID=8014 RepID=UPI0035100288
MDASSTSTPPSSISSSNTTPPDLHWAPDLHRLAHLDQALYRDFHSLWVSLMVLNSLMFVAGVALNSLALLVFCRHPPPSSAPVVYTINLAVADLLVALSLPARVALYHSEGSCWLCSYLHSFSYFVNMYCSILFLTSICVDRYLAVAMPMRSSRRWRSPAVARAVSGGVWALAVVVTYSLQSPALGPTSWSVPALFSLAVLEFLFPLVVMLGCTLRAAWVLLSHPQGMVQGRGRRGRAVRLLVVVLVVFTVCFGPFHVRQTLVYFRVVGEGPGQVLAYHATVTLSSLNSCLDPVVYCFVTDRFRVAVHRVCGRGRGEASEEARGGGGGEEERSFRESDKAVAIVQSVVTLTPLSKMDQSIYKPDTTTP